MTEPTMKYSDNPYIDAIVYYTKYLIIHSIIKDENEGDNNETITSIKESGKYIHKVKYEKQVVTDYTELNPYYAMLWGQPPVPTLEEILNIIPLGTGESYDNSKIDLLAYKDKYYIKMEPYQDMIDPSSPLDLTGKFFHTLTSSEYYNCKNCGIVDLIFTQYGEDSHYKYIHYVEHPLEPVLTRTATKFQLLYVPQIPDNDYNDIRSKFEIIYEKNKRYVMNAVYSDAMAFQNPYYDKFIILFLKIITMMDMVNDVFDYLIHKDIFDSRTIRYLFESYGVDYYSEIPTRYQIAMIKNMNTLLKYKSTNRNIIDIANLFGFPNITVFKYYLLKTRNGDQPLAFDDDGNEDFNANYNLEFVKVPIDGNIDDYINDPEYREPYAKITDNDPYWLGINDNNTDVYTNNDINIIRNDVKNELLKADFTCESTKYLSIDSTEDTASASIDMCYFYNMIYDGSIEEFTVKLPDYISTDPVPVGEVFAYMTALGYVYNNIEDDIITNDMEKTMYIYGFNFEAQSIEQLISGVKTKHTTIRDDFTSLDDGGVMDLKENFKTPPTLEAYTYQKFEEIFLSNRNLYDMLIEAMNDTDNYHVYNGYKTIFDSLMTTQCSLKYFSKMYGEGFDTSMTYTQWFEKVNISLSKSIVDCKSITNQEKRIITITEIFDECVYALQEVFTHERFSNMYSILPTKSAEFLVSCIVKVVNFFKSYKAQFITSSSLFTLQDPDDNRMDFLEDTSDQMVVTIPQTMSMLEYPAVIYTEEINDRDSIGTLDKVYVTITHE